MPDMNPTAGCEAPTLTCVIASYNHAPYVARSIEACLLIPVADKELVVIDDGSKDDSLERIQETVARLGANQAVRIVARENHGLVSSLNHALSLARGKFIYMIASDDLAIPDGVASLVQALRLHTQAGFALGNSLAFFDEADALSGVPVYAERHARYFALSAADRDATVFTDYPNPLLIQSTVFRREALARIGDFDPTIVLDDYPLFVRLMRAHAQVGEDFLFMPEVFASAYRQHAANSYRNSQRQVQMLTQVIERLCPPPGQAAALSRLYMHYALLAARGGRVGESLRLARSAFGRGYCQATLAFIREVHGYVDRSRNRTGPTTLPHPLVRRG